MLGESLHIDPRYVCPITGEGNRTSNARNLRTIKRVLAKHVSQSVPGWGRCYAYLAKMPFLLSTKLSKIVG